MAQEQKSEKRGPGGLSLWFQRRMNTRTNARIRKGRGRSMGMDLLVLHTTGRRSGAPRTWFADGDARLVVASGGGKRHPDWYLNLVAHPEAAAIELPGQDALPVAPQRLEGEDRARAWDAIAAAQPRYAKYQAKTDKEYPVVRLVPR